MATFREQIVTLGRLQEVDAQVDRLREEERQIPLLVEKTRENTKIAETKLEEKKVFLKSHQDQRRTKERELEEHERRIKADKVKLMEVKTNQEYQAVLKEIENIQKICDERSEDILLLLEQIDPAEMEVKKAQGQFDEAKRKIDTEAARQQERLSLIPAELAEVIARREELSKNIGADLLRRYNSLRRLKAGVAVVKAAGGVCTGCNMAVPPQMINKLHQNEELVYCANCQRILYWEGEARVNRVQPVVDQ